MGRTRWTVETALAESKKYRTRADFFAKAAGAHAFLDRHGLLDQALPESLPRGRPPRSTIKWTVATAMIEAEKYDTRSQFAAMVSSAYETLRLAGRLDEAFPKTRPQSRRPTKRRKPYTDPGPEGWTPDAIMAEAKCHPTKDAFYIAAPDAFIAAARLRLLPEATAHMTK